MGKDDYERAQHQGGQIKPVAAPGHAAVDEFEDSRRRDARREVRKMMDGLPGPGDVGVGQQNRGYDGGSEDRRDGAPSGTAHPHQQEGEEVEEEFTRERPGGRVPADVQTAGPTLQDEAVVDQRSGLFGRTAAGPGHGIEDERRDHHRLSR